MVREWEQEALVCAGNGSWVRLRPLAFELPLRTGGGGTVQKDRPHGGLQLASAGEGLWQRGEPTGTPALGFSSATSTAPRRQHFAVGLCSGCLSIRSAVLADVRQARHATCFCWRLLGQVKDPRDPEQPASNLTAGVKLIQEL